MRRIWLMAFLLLAPLAAKAEEGPSYGPELEGFEYPYPVQKFEFQSQKQSLHMAYVDVAPEGTANGHTVVLFHGKNFCAATWEGTIKALTKVGYRVIAVDQLGFCKSSKPAAYQYSFQQLAENTHALLEKAGVGKVIVMGHSLGGMLGMRYGLLYPDQVEELVLVSPIGLEDWKARGVPYQTIDQAYEGELKTTAERIKNYQLSTYYAGQWRPEYDKWVNMLAGMYRGPGKEIVAWNSALLYDMMATQPVYYEFEQLKMPVLLLIGLKDTTATGKERAAPEVRKTLGDYTKLGKEAAKRIPHVHLVEFDGLGHAPHLSAPDRFHKEVITWLAEQK